MSKATYTDGDIDENVVNTNGNGVGGVSEVRNGITYVDPVMFDSVKAKPEWEDADDNAYPLQDAEVMKSLTMRSGSTGSERAL